MKFIEVKTARENNITVTVDFNGTPTNIDFELDEWVECGSHEEPWYGVFVSVDSPDGKTYEIIGIYFGYTSSHMEFAELETNEITLA